MSFAIVQKELIVPDVERLTRAFCVLPDLTSIDAQNAAHDAYGILWRGLDAERAGALQAALAHEGLDTDLVNDSEFTRLGTGHVIQRIQITPDHLEASDPMHRVTRIPWNDVLLLAAGRVHDRVVRHGKAGAAESLKAPRSGDEERSRLIVDLFLMNRTTRFSLEAGEFQFDCLGTAATEDTAANYLLLLQRLGQLLPDASLNQGAFLACQTPAGMFSYPSKHAYQEELVWLLWRIGRLQAAAQGLQ